MNLPRLLKIDEVSEALRLSPRSVRRNVRLGRLPSPVRVGGSLRWREADIAEVVGRP